MAWNTEIRKWLPKTWEQALDALSPEQIQGAQELRIRAGEPICVRGAFGRRELDCRPSEREMERFILEACDWSPPAWKEQLRRGYLAPGGGFRIGIGGQLNEVTGLYQPIESLCIRIPHALPGVGEELFPQLWERGQLCSTLILAPPGGGKTTLLRDMVRLAVLRKLQVSVVDERGELSAMGCEGADILSGMNKAEGIARLLRTMSPQVMAVDEIGSRADAQALLSAAHCGVTLLATAHGEDARVLAKPEMRILTGVFRRLILLDAVPGRSAQVLNL